MSPAEEVVVYERLAGAYGVDALLMGAVRLAERGGPGRECGVGSMPAPTVEDQFEVLARSVRNSLVRFGGNPLTRWPSSTHSDRLCVTLEWLRWFGRKWAPVGAGNDPDALNSEWARNVWSQYIALVGGATFEERWQLRLA
jgi:hypothetical protein